jgi:hypothetical protein
MALVHLNVAVGTTPTKMFTVQPAGGAIAVSIQNNHGAAIYVGDSSITTGSVNQTNQGHIIAAGATYQIWMNAQDTLYGIAAAATAAGAVSVLYSGV